MKRTNKYLDHFAAEDLMFASFRYFLGSKSIQAAWFFKCLDKSWVDLPLNIKELITRESEKYARENE